MGGRGKGRSTNTPAARWATASSVYQALLGLATGGAISCLVLYLAGQVVTPHALYASVAILAVAAPLAVRAMTRPKARRAAIRVLLRRQREAWGCKYLAADDAKAPPLLRIASQRHWRRRAQYWRSSD